uniref:Uncharacterized protein n=1 Tax=Leptobrachium leishanense TaxID=445787 RepID=A0A8C5R0S4_9ANUR
MMASTDLRDELNCSICLNIYTDPVNLKCGHNYCKLCIGNVLDTQKESGIYSCPECRAEYRERPKLQRNMTLCNIAERCRSTQPAQHVTGISCTYCVHAPVPAAKTCLHCEASLCETHLKVHSQSTEHVLTEPTTSLAQRKCSIHKEILKYYCTIDAVCICVSCSLAGDHRGHQVETLNVAHGKKKQRLRNAMDKLKKQSEEAEKEIQDLTKHEKEVKVKADGMKEKVRVLIMDARRQLEALEKKVLTEISAQEKNASLLISHQINQLEKKKSEMSKDMGYIKELQNLTDPLVVLKGRESFGAGCGGALKGVKHDLRVDVISGILQRGLDIVIPGLKRTCDILKITKILMDVNTFPEILLNVNTASNVLTVSSDLETVCRADTKQYRPETPERFEFYPQVLSIRGFTSSRYYWEVETSGDGWIIGMAYPSIDRKENYYSGYGGSPISRIESYIGDSKSWRLRFYNNRCSVMYDGKVEDLRCGLSSQRLAIYLDFEAGQLSFYELSYHLTHIHTFTARFTEPLHVAICVWGNASVTIIN